MKRIANAVAAASVILGALSAAVPACAQKSGGILKVYMPDSPASMSIHEEVIPPAQSPMMGVFNNLVMFDQHVKQNSLGSIVPDLATGWSWNEDGTELTFPLQQGVKWHDGRPFTAADVKCTWDLLLDQGPEKLRVNPRKTYYRNLDRVSTNGDFEVTFRLKRPQPAFPMLLADGFMAIYPCHAPPREMRQHPIGTGPFKFVEFKPNEYVKVARNPAYWKKDRPYLDGIEYIIIRDRATAVLAFVSGKFDMTFPNYLTIPLVKDIQSQMPQVICELSPEAGVNRHLLINRDKPPFDNRNVRQAMALSLDRKAFIDTLTEGQGDIGGVLQPPLGGLWGMPPDLLEHLPGFPDVQKRRTQARQIMEQMGYGPDNRLKTRISIRNMPLFRDPAVILIDQLKEIYIGGELEPIDTTAYYPTILRKDYAVGLNLATSGPDPDPILDLFYGCGSSLNWDGYCSPEVDSLIEQQSREGDPEKRKPLLWAIEQKLAQDVARPILFYGRNGTCWQPWVKEVTIMVNSLFNGNRREDVWLDK